MLESERLLLRKFDRDDILPSYEINLDPEVSRYTMDGGVHTLDEIDKLITHNILGDYLKHGFGRLAVVYKPDQKLIGFTGLKFLEDLQEVDLGYRFDRHYWGRGIATEASTMVLRHGFEHLDLDRVIAMAHRENFASIRIMQKLGFRWEREWIEEGQPVVCYALDRAEFRCQPSAD